MTENACRTQLGTQNVLTVSYSGGWGTDGEKSEALITALLTSTPKSAPQIPIGTWLRPLDSSSNLTSQGSSHPTESP